MKTRQVLCLTFVILLAVGWQASVGAQDIPANYIQNPNMEHELNSIFWYGGWDVLYGSNGIARYPATYLTEDDSHSGNVCMTLQPGGWIWVSYPVRGQEEKKMKASFWYRGYFASYWNFIYRDVGMTYEDLHPTLAEFTGADSAVWGGAGQNSMQFLFGGDDDWTEDWTYFEFVWDMPGTIPGWGNTTMWQGTYAPAYVDDLYYGEWYDGQYSGEEPFDFINGDFEATALNIEWLVNVDAWSYFGKDDYLSWTENHTDAGLQSLRLQDYKLVSIDTIDTMAPIQADSILIDTTANDKNVTYYLPALGAEGENMEMSFWYKGNDATVALEFYDDYGVTTAELPLPDGATLRLDSVWTTETIDVPVVDTVASVLRPVFTIDSSTLIIDTLDGEWLDVMSQDWEGQAAIDNPTPFAASGSFWSDEDFYAGGWSTILNGGGEAYGGWSSLWLPGDAGWTGPYGESPPMVVDNTKQRITFMYKGKLNLWLTFSAYTKYDLTVDPDGIVPVDATVDDGELWWELDNDQWTEFSFEWDQGSWLADSSLADTVPLYFTIGSGYVVGENGFIDDLKFQRWTVLDPARIDTAFATTYALVTEHNIDETVRIDTVDQYWDVWDAAAVWDLPAATDWTEWMLKWTNPATDIGGTLTLLLDNDPTASPDLITPDKPGFDDTHAGWSYFDDFVYSIADPDGINSDLVSFDLHTYPNPASEVLYLSLEIPLERVTVYNSMGQLVMNQDYPERKLNIAALEEGMYFINATDELGVVHKAKFIKR